MSRGILPHRLLAALWAVVFVLFPALAWAAPIRLWHAYRGDEEKALLEILSMWKGEPIDTLAVPFDAYAAKLQAAIPLGDGPDLFIDAHERMGDYRARGIIAPAGDALESEAVFSGPALAAVKDGGRVWAVPLSQKSLALYRNIDLAPEAPADLEAIAELQGKLPKGVFALAYEAQNAYAHAPILAAFGGRLLGEGDGFGFVGPAAESSIALVRSLIDEGAVPEAADGALVTNLFRTGRAAFTISGPWLAADLAGSPVRYQVEMLPRVRATGRPMRPLLTVESLFLSPKGAGRPEVRALARLLGGKEAGRIRTEKARTPPARIDVDLPADDATVRAFAAQAEQSIPMPTSQAMRAVWEPAARALKSVLRGDKPADVALPEAKRRFDDVRRPLPPPASPVLGVIAFGLLALLGALYGVRRARAAEFRVMLRRSMPAYRYVAHAVIAVGLLVVIPLVIGAAISLFAGSREAPRYVGLANFIDILTARGGPLLASGSFYVVLLVTVLWTAVNVTFHVTFGVILALCLSRPAMRLRALYRVLLIVPWAVPSYVTALAWKGMFHRQFGAVTGLILAINDMLGTSIQPIAWFSRFSTAFTANVATNVWLGFPFMMVVTLGALTAIPEDVLEAAKVDGATRWQRLRLVTLPMIRPVLMPAVTLGAIWTFNMFNVVFLVSGGDPDGTTDILVSEAYRWAFTREQQYGYAAAYSVLILLLLMGMTRWMGRREDREGKPPAAAAPVQASAVQGGAA